MLLQKLFFFHFSKALRRNLEIKGYFLPPQELAFLGGYPGPGPPKRTEWGLQTGFLGGFGGFLWGVIEKHRVLSGFPFKEMQEKCEKWPKKGVFYPKNRSNIKNYGGPTLESRIRDFGGSKKWSKNTKKGVPMSKNRVFRVFSKNVFFHTPEIPGSSFCEF